MIRIKESAALIELLPKKFASARRSCPRVGRIGEDTVTDRQGDEVSVFDRAGARSAARSRELIGFLLPDGLRRRETVGCPRIIL
jgi:hypothetical protein